MRISDWSSDVCSSDLEEARRALRHGRPDFGGDARLDRRKRDEQREAKTERDDERAGRGTGTVQVRERETEERAFWPWQATRGAAHQPAEPDEDQQEPDRRADKTEREQGLARSEEHTSELQPLMRISYDVFCLKNK